MNERNNHLSRPHPGARVIFCCVCLLCAASAFAKSHSEGRQRELDAQRMDGDGLSESENKHEGGGMHVPLKGRFSSPVTGIVDRDGKVKIGHFPLPDDDDDEDEGDDHKNKPDHDGNDDKGGAK